MLSYLPVSSVLQTRTMCQYGIRWPRSNRTILKRWDTAATGVRICCVKFVQKVVQVQTPGLVADPRVCKVATAPSVKHCADATLQRPDQNEVSLALVPRDHPLIPPPRLEPEASGLLDRLLNVFSEDVGYVQGFKNGFWERSPDALRLVMPFLSTQPLIALGRSSEHASPSPTRSSPQS